MGCLIAILAMLSPRIAILFVWGFSNRMAIAFESGFVAVLGFLFFPWTTLIYALAYAPIGGVSFVGWCFVAFGFLCDLGSLGSSARARR